VVALPAPPGAGFDARRGRRRRPTLRAEIGGLCSSSNQQAERAAPSRHDSIMSPQTRQAPG
jgi:hypothetical protein